MPPMHIPWLLLFMAMLSSSGGGSGSRSKCGGIYTAAHGILQTPRFPNEFPTPINCEWIIDAQNIATANTSIVVYLTQLYLYEGLTFTEYQIYDTTYQLDGRTVHTVNETNVVQIRWVQSFQNFLVVSLKLDSVDSAHLRVLDKFLDVYGFNITYEITTKPVRSDACTMMDCGFTGICYDHYTKFSCNCFPGYEGPHCSSGPSSFCSRGGSATCKNGGTCIHVGVSAVKCLCPKEFTGDTCQIPISSQTTNACEKCVTSCPFDGRLENACKCKTAVLNATSSERVGYTCTMHLSNLPNLNGEALKTFIKNQVWRTLKSNYSKLEDVAVESIDHFRSGADVTFYFFAMKKDEKRVRSILSKWADRGYIANLTVADKEFIFRPVLDLQSVSINQAGGVIRQQDEFILSCVARGSPTMSFRWFKDGVFVNVSDTSSKWNRLIKDPDSEDQYTALLGVERSDSLDSGVFACQIEDYGMQQCLSTRVLVRAPPVVKVDPMSRTVRKGDNLTIKCISMGESTLKYTYSWTKNKGLIPVRTENEKYEILYPGGSILQVQKVEKSVKYSCLVQDEVASSETEVDVHVVNPDVVRTCPPENYLGIEWPETAPDTDGMSECPKGYAFPGYVRRSCVFNNGLTPVWRQPDYSHCVSEKLHKIELNFRLLQLGYETAAPIQILEDSLYYLASRSNNNEDSSGGGMGLGLLLYPGEGTRILLLVRDVVSYIKRQRYTGNGNSNSNSNSEFATTRNVTTVVFDVVDGILRQENSLIDQEQIRLLQEVVSQQVTLSSSLLNKLEPSIHLSYKTIDVNMALLGETKNGDISFPAANNDTKWIAHKARVIQKGHPKEKNSIKRQPQPIVVASVIYRNLTTFLPVRSSIRLKDGAEIEYEVVSQIVRLWLLNVNEDFRQSYGAVEWIIHRKTNVSRDGWFLRCGVAEVATFAYGWNTTECVTENVNSTWTTCLCPRLGTIALLLTANNVQVEQEPLRPRRYLVLAGCSFCFLSALICTIFLAAHWILKRSCIIFLKLQCSISVTGVMLTFFLATIVEPPEGMFTNIMTLIEILLLMGLSAHVSTLLVVYTELVQLPKAATSKQTVIGISTGVPVIAVFGNHLAHRTMDVRLRSWWMLAGTLAFHIFVTVSTVIFALFLFLYFTVVSKLRRLTVVHEKDGKILQRRIRLLRKSACVCCSLVMVTTSSVLYINFSEVIWWHYEFCVSTVLLGLTLVVCYVITSETRLSILLQEKLKAKTKEGFFGVEPTGSPLNFFTKEDAEVESESIPHRKSETHHHLSKSVECFQMTDACKSALPECVSGTIESFIHHEDIMFRNGSRDQTVMIATEHLERYNHSPQLYRKNTTFKIDEEAAAAKAPPVPARCRSPDIIASKTCTALDLVMSHAPSIVITPEEPSVEQQNVTTTVATSNEDWSLKRQASQDDALPVSTKVAEVAPSVTTSSPTPSEDNLDGMLDRISHDLDYLLNRGDAEISTVTNAGSLRRVPKTPPSVIVEVDEETESEETKVPEAITDILRTNC